MSNNSNSTFWKLIKEYQIEIPRLQRDYAQGRKGILAIEQIRTALLDELYNHLCSGEALELNFIYGKTKTDLFIPIDGQQRLTTLFLFHWYIFKRSNFEEGIMQLKRFVYKTRDTSARFCQNLCESTVDFSQKSIEEQLKDSSWFTGNYYGDPTVSSMIVMLDCIHAKFKETVEFETLKNKLIDDDCPISFLWLKMEDFQQDEDLYIKMNARGKLLSDFEIFKAKLQRSELLSLVLGENATEPDRVTYISNFNNKYAELFYSYFEDKFDKEMMDFVKSVIRDDYFCYVVDCQVEQRVYRDPYSTIQRMNGNVFFAFLEKEGLNAPQCKDTKKIFANSIEKIDALLEKFSALSSFDDIKTASSKKYYNEHSLFINKYNQVVRFALYSYLHKFGIPATDEEVAAYDMWKRFVYNIDKNTDLGGHTEYICQSFSLFNYAIQSLDKATEDNVLNAIIATANKNKYAFLKYSLDEEKEKAQLMLPAGNANEWYKAILAVENYFTDGQIGFLIRFSKKDSVPNIDLFKSYFERAKKVIDKDKVLHNRIPDNLLDRALLCMPDSTSGCTGHLIKQDNSTTTWGFLNGKLMTYLSNRIYENSKPQQEIFKQLLIRLEDSDDINLTLGDIVSKFDISLLSPKGAWKKYFIKSPQLFDVKVDWYVFRKCIHLAESNKIMLLLTGTTVRAYSMEVNTMLLYLDLKHKLKSMKLHWETTGNLNDENGFPTRYIEWKNVFVGYSTTQSQYLIRQDEDVKAMTYDQAKAFILNL